MKINDGNTSASSLRERLKALRKPNERKETNRAATVSGTRIKSSIGQIATESILELHKRGENLQALKRGFVTAILTNEFSQKIANDQLCAMIESTINNFTLNKQLDQQLDQLITNIISNSSAPEK
ncbi:hypothetical protein [Microbulbifer sp. TYP-18]|uniref:hypothetical protein n=1 Tax=Microbulbifer sp. TYP-18 TaxID=3230024 RepID=UPI0034C5E179